MALRAEAEVKDELAEQSKAVCADHMKRGDVALVLVWKPSGDFNYYNPSMRTAQMIELLRDAIRNLCDAEPDEGHTLQ